MRVSIDARYLRRAGTGVAEYLLGLVEEVAAAHDVILLTSSEAHGRQLTDEHPGLQIEVLQDRREVTWEQLALPRYLRSSRPAIHIAGGNRGLPAQSVPCPLALVVHDLIPLRYPKVLLLPDPLSASRYLAGTAASLLRASLVIANSRSTRTDVQRIYRGDLVVRYPTMPSAPLTASDPPPDWPTDYFVYNGGASSRKNVATLIEAHSVYCAAKGTISLLLLGNNLSNFQSSIDAHVVPSMVVTTGYVLPQLKWTALARARALFYPSDFEGFGLPIIEAFAAATPVVAGRGGAQAEIGGDAVLYADPVTRGALSTYMHQLGSATLQADLIARGTARLEALRTREHVNSLLPALERLRAGR
jgi:glycosyltransferase involved in cell wall biosynthesis